MGLASTVISASQVEYLFGNVSLYQSFESSASNRLVGLLEQIYRPPTPLLLPARSTVQHCTAEVASLGWQKAGGSGANSLSRQ